MGNCAFKGNPEPGGGNGRSPELIRVATCNGGVMEFHPPITAECITNGFPAGHAIYRTRDMLAKPMMHNEELLAGELYYLRPIYGPLTAVNVSAPYRVSFGHRNLEVRHVSGMWKVKVVITPAKLAEILAEESRTGEFVESVRTVAKCGGLFAAATTSVASSDQWSLASSRRTSA